MMIDDIQAVEDRLKEPQCKPLLNRSWHLSAGTRRISVQHSRSGGWGEFVSSSRIFEPSYQRVVPRLRAVIGRFVTGAQPFEAGCEVCTEAHGCWGHVHDAVPTMSAGHMTYRHILHSAVQCGSPASQHKGVDPERTKRNGSTAAVTEGRAGCSSC